VKRRRTCTALLVAGLFLAGGSVVLARVPARVQVVAKEYSFALSRLQLRGGAATVELVNRGEDPHDLRLRRIGARHIAGFPVVAPGDHVDVTLLLPPGRYTFWCSIANHRKLGMHGTLVVTR
jgi:plastocyanin